MRQTLFRLSAVAIVASSIWGQTTVTDERRIALVIGNSEYSSRGRPLKNPVNDARAMSQVLTDLGFDVRSVLNATQAGMDRAIREFVGSLGPGAVGVLYYAGHGVQIEGLNYVLPIDYDERGLDELSVKRASIRVDEDIVTPMERSGARLNLLILDACRDNPYLAGRGRSASRGLAPMDPARGTAILFAAATGQQAEDNPAENNGIFTKHLVSTLREPGLSLGEITEIVAGRVDEATKGQQQPAYYTQVVGRFVLNPGPRQGTTLPLGLPNPPESPKIVQLTADRQEVASNQTVMLTVAATDPNADTLQYFWSTSAGRIEGRGTTAVFSPGPTAAARGISSATIRVTARNSRGLEARSEIAIRVQPAEVAAPEMVLGRAIAIGSSIEVWLESQAAAGGEGSGIIEADLEAVENVWQVIRVRGGFPGVAIDVSGECRNCTLLSIVEHPSAANGFLRARMRVRPVNPAQPMSIGLRYQALRSGRRR